MPLYGTSSNSVFSSGVVAPVFARELITAGQASVSVCMPTNEVAARSYSANYAFTDVNGNPANPGAFEIDLEHADVDTGASPNNFVKAASITGNLNSSYVGRTEMTNVVTKFVRMRLVSIANTGVYLTASVVK